MNPNYIPRLQFTLEQPLLRLFGVEANQLSPSHPGSQILNLQPSGGQGTEGILISRIRVDQQKMDFEMRINYMLVNVEAAYWNLYAAYYNLFAQEEGLRQAFEGLRFIQVRVEAGNDPPQNAYQASAQFHRFESQVYQARGQVLEAERNLRGLLNLRSDDGTRIVPIDKPNEAPFKPDFYDAANSALANRPELMMLRQDLKAQQLNLRLQINLRQPDLRMFGQYDIAGLGTRLDGKEFANAAGTIPGNALASFGNNQFNSWTIGLRMDMPIGFRDANAAVREAQMNLARSYFSLRDNEMKTLEFLVSSYRRLIQAHAVIRTLRAEREDLQIYIGKVKEVIVIGRWDPAYYQNYLTVQQQLATAIANEFRAVADYNTALAAFEFAKGTIKEYNNVTLGEGPLPPWVSKKAADHIRERTEAALKLRERDLAPPPAGQSGRAARQLGRRLERGSSTTCRHSLAGRRRNPRCSRRQSRSTRRTRRRNRCRRAIARSARAHGRPLRPSGRASEAERGLGAIDARLLPTIRHRDGTHPRDAGTGNADDLPIGSGLDSLPVPPVAASSAMPPLTTPAATIGDFGAAGRLPTIPILTESRSTTSGGR